MRLKKFWLVIALTTFFLAGCDILLEPTDEPTPSATSALATRTTVTRTTAAGAATLSSAATARATATPNDGLKIIAFTQLPPEARTTISLIDKGGPFPFDRDGIVFENRERLLPLKSAGYYHEYTVITPGSNDRGAGRIIKGNAGELYYTDDHYESFKRITR
jgi:ribonuclease T1